MLTRALESDFHTLLVTGRPDPREGELTDDRVQIHRIPLKREVDVRADAAAYRSLREIIETNDIDLVHTHMAKAGTLARTACLRARRRPVSVHTFHGHVLQGYFSKPVERFFVGVERFLARRTTALVAVSEEIRVELLELGIGGPEQWHVIPLGFDLGELLEVSGHTGVLRSRMGIGDDVALVGVLGRLAPIKDHVTLVRAIARVPDAHLAVLGDGETRDEIAAEIERLGLSQRVHFMGWVTEVASAIADLDVVALTSRNEGTPVSLIEASAAARPVVSTDVGGVRSVVKDAATGYVVPAGDVAAVSSAIDSLLADRELARRFGHAGRGHVRDRFDQQRLVTDVRKLYEQLLSSR